MNLAGIWDHVPPTIASPDPIIPGRPDWHHGAPCNGMLDVFYPQGMGGPVHDAYELARMICAECPVHEQCLAEVDDESSSGRHGFRAGMTPQERHLRAGRKVRVRVCVECDAVLPQGYRPSICSDECRRVRHNRQKEESRIRRIERDAEQRATRDRFLRANGLTPKRVSA